MEFDAATKTQANAADGNPAWLPAANESFRRQLIRVGKEDQKSKVKAWARKTSAAVGRGKGQAEAAV